MDIKKIRNAATNFRNAIENCKSSLGLAFSSFPRGNCGDATPMLGTYLIEQGLGEFQYMLGNYGRYGEDTWSSHAWLQLDDLIVDITADQFPEVAYKVIVQNESKWHKNLHGEPQHLADFRIYDPHTVSRLGIMYQRIVECINEI